MKNKIFAGYESPDVEVLKMSVECGFAGSPQVEDPERDPEQDW